MTNRVTVSFVWAVAAGALLAVPAAAQPRNDGLVQAAPASNDPNAPGIEEKIGATVPLDVEFRDQDRNVVTLRQAIAGKPTILVPMYYRCPMLCNVVLKNLVETLREMPQDFTAGGKFNVVCISIDPKEEFEYQLVADKKKVTLKEYGREGAEAGWWFLTGPKDSVNSLMQTVGYRYEFDKSIKEYNHPSGLIILTPEGKVARYFYGISYDGEFEVPGGKTTLRLSLVEASDGKIGSLTDRLILLCYRYDHLNKGYSLSVMRAVRLGGILTLLVVGLCLFVAFRRERRARASRENDHNDTPAGGTAAARPNEPHDGLPSGGTA